MNTCILLVKVIPQAQYSEYVGWHGEELKIRIKAPPEKGKANTELIRFLAKTLCITKNAITILSGETSRHKRVKIEGYNTEELMSLTGFLQ